MDVQATLLVMVGAQLGISRYAQAAAAFLATGMDLFVDVMPRLKGASPLLPSQVALGKPEGDIHTAVKWFLTWLSCG